MNPLFDHLKRLFDEGHGRPVNGLRSDAPFSIGKPVEAAVLIAVTQRAEPGVILTRRPTDMRDHPGQVAFPGGKVEPGETPVEAALREAWEELHLDPDQVRVIGATDRYQTGTGFDITPVLGVVPPDLDLRPNPAEVEAWFEAPLATLLTRATWDEREAEWRGGTRRYLEYHHQGFRIWGVTAAIIANLSRRLAWEELRNQLPHDWAVTDVREERVDRD